MPTYEYRCNACGHQFDEFQMYSEAQLKKCPKCHKNKLQRLFGTGGGIIFKGSGFYETDYRSEAYKKAAKADQDAGKPPATGTTGTTDKGSTAANTGAADKGSGATESGGKSEAKSPKSSRRKSDD